MYLLGISCVYEVLRTVQRNVVVSCPSAEEKLSGSDGLNSHSTCYTSRATMIWHKFSIMEKNT